MPRVHCKLPNASANINGVPFAAHPEGGVVSDELSDEQAQAFAEIPGFSIVGDDSAAKAAAAQKAADDAAAAQAAADKQAADDKAAADAADAAAAQKAADDELATLRARGVELQIPNAIQMGAKRLKGEIAEAEKKAADASGAAPQA